VNWRYVTRAHVATNAADISVTASDVIVEDERVVDSGLLNADGEKLYRQPDRVPFGFHHHKPRVRVKAGSR
jgi:hypothetical protein